MTDWVSGFLPFFGSWCSIRLSAKSRLFCVSGFARSIVSSCVCGMVQWTPNAQKCNFLQKILSVRETFADSSYDTFSFVHFSVYEMSLNCIGLDGKCNYCM